MAGLVCQKSCYLEAQHRTGSKLEKELSEAGYPEQTYLASGWLAAVRMAGVGRKSEDQHYLEDL